ncbi:hypothetical protein Scep_008095 [Stephania cephalantha]|uniref:RING-type domain-containing protein n=1 Tax=Stephania cephalantha TaxID=152367 RepID=A0AAP0KB13_9MAGN
MESTLTSVLVHHFDLDAVLTTTSPEPSLPRVRNHDLQLRSFPTVVDHDEDIDDDDDEEKYYYLCRCIVCMEDIKNDEEGKEGKLMPCRHVYHANCISTWLSLHDTCPLCRSPISSSGAGKTNSSSNSLSRH